MINPNNNLKLVQISKSYSIKNIIQDINLELHSGEVVGLFGPNGAGKTTCFYVVAGLIRANCGAIFLNEYDITDLPMYKRALMGIGYLPQESSIFRGLTVRENILSILEVHDSMPDRRQTRLYDLLHEFKIDHIANVKGYALSGGERRRVEIARVLAINPQFILLDEPLAGVDPIAVDDIKETIKYLKSKQIGIFITDHNVRETLKIVDRVYVLSNGRIISDGSPQEIVNDSSVKRLYLGEEFEM